MSYTLIKDLTTINKTVTDGRTIKYIVIHYTGNTTDLAKSNANYFRNINRGASAHYFVDKTTVYQVVEDKDVAWAVGRNYGSNNLFGIVTNNNSISIEMCSNDSAIADETFNNTIILTKELMEKYDIPVSNIFRHYDVCSKKCPGWNGWGTGVGGSELWDKFKNSLTTTSNSTTNKYSVGQKVTFWTSYPTSTSPCGVAYATSGGGNGAITAIVSGQAKYCIDGTRYCNDGDIRGLYVEPVINTVVSSPSATTTKKILNANVYYRVYAGGKWYSEVTDLNDFAGDGKNAIRAIAIKVSDGSIKYRVHVRNGNWYSYITGYNINNSSTGYAGDKKNDIDAIEAYYTTPIGYVCKKIKYRLSPIGGNYYSWQTDNDKENGMDGYAGNIGTSFGKFQAILE